LVAVLVARGGAGGGEKKLTKPGCREMSSDHFGTSVVIFGGH
jgi:hypothetical protein